MTYLQFPKSDDPVDIIHRLWKQGYIDINDLEGIKMYLEEEA